MISGERIFEIQLMAGEVQVIVMSGYVRLPESGPGREMFYELEKKPCLILLWFMGLKS